MHSAGFGACGMITAARVVSLARFELIALNFLRCCLCAHRLPGIALDQKVTARSWDSDD
jgi:hypothetical protein